MPDEHGFDARLAPCPWCGANAFVTNEADGESDAWRVACSDQGCTMDGVSTCWTTIEDAIADWNKWVTDGPKLKCGHPLACRRRDLDDDEYCGWCRAIEDERMNTKAQRDRCAALEAALSDAAIVLSPGMEYHTDKRIGYISIAADARLVLGAGVTVNFIHVEGGTIDQVPCT